VHGIAETSQLVQIFPALTALSPANALNQREINKNVRKMDTFDCRIKKVNIGSY